MNEADFLASQSIQFIDDSEIDWNRACRAHFSFYQRFYYEYPGPIHNLKQSLIIIPADHSGIQWVRDHFLVFDPQPIIIRKTADRFGVTTQGKCSGKGLKTDNERHG